MPYSFSVSTAVCVGVRRVPTVYCSYAGEITDAFVK